MSRRVDRVEDEEDQYRPSANDDVLSVRAIMGMFSRRALPMVATAILVIVIISALALMGPRLYTARALLMVSPGHDRVLAQGDLVASPEGAGGSGAVDSEIEILRAPMLMERIVADLNIAADPEWRDALSSTSPIGAVKDWLRDIIVPRSNAADGGDVARARWAGTVGRAFHIERRGSSFVIQVAATADNPQRAAMLANALTAAYLQAQVESRMQTEAQANSWLGRRVSELRDEVREKEAAVEAYRAATGLLSASGSSLAEQETSDLQAAVLAARANLAQTEARHAQIQEMIRTGASLDSVANVLNSATVQELRGRQADIARREADMTQRYEARHPALQAIQAEREDNQRQISAEITRISANLGNEVMVARAQLRSLQGSMSSMRGELNENNAALVRLRELEREAAATRTVYEAFLQRSQEIADQGTMRMSQSRLVSAATPPLGRDPPRIPMLLALAAGLAAGLLCGMLIELFDDTLNNAEDVDRKLGAPLLASVPMLSHAKLRTLSAGARNPPGYLIEKPMSSFAEACRVLRTSLVYARSGKPTQILAMTSAMPNEGKTTLAICLARVTALMGQRALLIDCDLRRRSVNEVLGLQPSMGLLQVLQSPGSWRQALLTDAMTGMDLLPLTQAEFTTRDVFGSDAMSALLNELRGHYDLIVLDCAPMLAVAETRTLVAMSDAVTVVARWEKTPVRAIRAALSQIESANVGTFGIALNCVQPRGATYRDGLYFSGDADGYYQQ